MIDACELQGRIRAALAAAGDAERAAGQQRYMKSAMPFYGVRVPEARRIAQAAVAGEQCESAGEWQALVRQVWDEAVYREERYAAMALCRDAFARPWQSADNLPLYGYLIKSGAWWDFVDELAKRVGELLAIDRAAVEPVLRQWSRGDDLWLRRAAILCQLGKKDQLDFSLLTDLMAPSIDDHRFFLQKAIGWALRDAAHHDRQVVVDYLAETGDRLSTLAVREALKQRRKR